MSFSFNWNAFAKQEAFQSHIHDMLTSALNKGKPSILEDKIRVVNLDWGCEAPTLEMLEIGDVAADRFRGVFKLNYTGGATITVATKVQANPLNVFANGAPSKFVMPNFVAAPVSFPIPSHLTLHNIRLQGTVIVVFSKQGGSTLVFRNDPSQSIEVNSTFDKFATIASFLQQQIETQIRNSFREEVPSISYRLSLKYSPPHNQASLGLNNKPPKENIEPVPFASIDTERPVSLVNILHSGAMSQSRSTSASETPIMPTAIVRSELYHRASSLSQRQSHMSNLNANDQDVYDESYMQAKHIGQRSQRKSKRRTIKLNKNKNKNNNNSHTEATTAETRVSNTNIRSSSVNVNMGDPAFADADREVVPPRRVHTMSNSSIPEFSEENANTEAAMAIIEAKIAAEKPQALDPTLDQIVPPYTRTLTRSIRPVETAKSRKGSGTARRFPLRSIVRDAKGFTTFSIRAPQHIVVPPGVLHPDLWSLPPVQDTDESPPAYVA